ncbi:hypothetical protein HAX54_029039 [Datura stramonium]|uniref:Uncharacterized protein n=1 Tax=Datura stramonium TaxID=4076 RepID=A0ABS8V598_DATST|nr:hypothetical protein [Datura stramonium]
MGLEEFRGGSQADGGVDADESTMTGRRDWRWRSTDDSGPGHLEGGGWRGRVAEMRELETSRAMESWGNGGADGDGRSAEAARREETVD